MHPWAGEKMGKRKNKEVGRQIPILEKIFRWGAVGEDGMSKNEEFFIAFVRRRRTRSRWSFKGFEGRRQLKAEQLECRLPGMFPEIFVLLLTFYTSSFFGCFWAFILTVWCECQEPQFVLLRLVACIFTLFWFSSCDVSSSI